MVVVSNLSLFLVNGGVVVHGRGFESLILGVNGGECMVKGSNLGLFGGQLWCNNHPQNQQSQTNPTQTIEATRLVFLNIELRAERQLGHY
jgi:hypothetical protein